jgi:hypothetical protein
VGGDHQQQPTRHQPRRLDLRDEDGHRSTFDDYRLRGRSTVRVHTGIGRDTRSDVYQDCRHYVWDNRSDTATLRNYHGRRIDDESWGTTATAAATDTATANPPPAAMN